MVTMSPEIKERHQRKIYEAAPMIECACGCGRRIKAVNRFGRPRQFVNGHNGRKYVDPKQYRREWNHRNKEHRYAARMTRFRMLKVRLVQLFGGRCVGPGFDGVGCSVTYNGRNASVFHFHHREQTEKCFALGNQLTNRAWDAIVEESKKCDMLCANCHEMRHSGEF
jgi:hypothetical protein